MRKCSSLIIVSLFGPFLVTGLDVVVVEEFVEFEDS